MADSLLNDPPSPERSTSGRILSGLAVAAVLALAVLLAVRPLSSPDLGYHLAYGERLLDTGHIVDHNEFLYTLPAGGELPAPGPGCWYDSQGRYRFPNANWLSQAAMAGVWRHAGGANGLCTLQASLVAGIFLLTLLTMRRCQVPCSAAAGGLLLVAMTAYMRFTLRPEVFGYLLLAAQLFLLSGRRTSRLTVAGLALLQLLLVNVHSYFLLGLLLTGAFLADRLLRLRWKRLGDPQRDVDRARLKAETIRLAAALAAQTAACFANPWTWRLAALPIQTLIFLNANDVAAAGPAGDGHPWSYIGEFFRPLAQPFLHTKATYAYCLLLGLSACGAIAAAIRRRWAWLLVIALLAAVSLTMRRNIAPASMLIAPVALGALHRLLGGAWGRLSGRARREIAREFAGATLAAAAWFAFAVASQRFYFNERSPVRFGVGLSRLHLPLDAARRIGRGAGPGRIWADYDSSSNLHYFTPGRPGVPIVTNTWAYPPVVMREVLEASADGRAFREAAGRFGVSVVELRAGRATGRLVRYLAESPDWALVHIDARHVVFERRTDAVKGSAEPAITEAGFDAAAFVARIATLDAVPAAAIHLGGLTLYHLGWDSAAIEVFAAAVQRAPGYYEAWNMRGLCLARRGTRRIRAGDHRGRADWREARQAFLKALEIKPDHAPARRNLQLVETQLRQIQRGVIYAPLM